MPSADTPDRGATGRHLITHGLSNHPLYELCRSCKRQLEELERRCGEPQLCDAWRDLPTFIRYVDERLGPRPSGRYLDSREFILAAIDPKRPLGPGNASWEYRRKRLPLRPRTTPKKESRGRKRRRREAERDARALRESHREPSSLRRVRYKSRERFGPVPFLVAKALQEAERRFEAGEALNDELVVIAESFEGFEFLPLAHSTGIDLTSVFFRIAEALGRAYDQAEQEGWPLPDLTEVDEIRSYYLSTDLAPGAPDLEDWE